MIGGCVAEQWINQIYLNIFIPPFPYRFRGVLKDILSNINSHWPINPKVQPVPPTLSCKSPGQAEIWKFLILNATEDDVDECFLHVFFAREHQGSQKEIARQWQK